MIRKQQSKIILNSRDVTAIDSAGDGKLVAAYTAMKITEGRWKLPKLPRRLATCTNARNLPKYSGVHR